MAKVRHLICEDYSHDLLGRTGLWRINCAGKDDKGDIFRYVYGTYHQLYDKDFTRFVIIKTIEHDYHIENFHIDEFMELED
jgi:hypothetical protein